MGVLFIYLKNMLFAIHLQIKQIEKEKRKWETTV
jgi:hypothetical protein